MTRIEKKKIFPTKDHKQEIIFTEILLFRNPYAGTQNGYRLRNARAREQGCPGTPKCTNTPSKRLYDEAPSKPVCVCVEREGGKERQTDRQTLGA